MSARFIPGGFALVEPSRASRLVALVLRREIGRYLEGWPLAERAEVLRLVDALSAAGDAFVAGSEVGTSELPRAEQGARCGRDEMSAGEAAVVLGVTDRQVRKLAIGGLGRKVGHVWVLDRLAVEAFAEQRRCRNGDT